MLLFAENVCSHNIVFLFFVYVSTHRIELFFAMMAIIIV
jgi:hypothetical protein